MKYRYRAAEAFWKSFCALRPEQKESVRAAWLLFKEDPFHPRLRTHKIHRLSSALNRTVHAVVIEGDLRFVFYIDGGTVFTFGIGSHDIYKPQRGHL